jgi:Domain of unknown function (DUF4276)
MVKLGFICEGETEKIIIESSNFKKLLAENNCSFVKAFDATGNGNLLPKNIAPMINNLVDEGAEKIFILTDLDEDECITKTKERINAPAEIIVIVSVKQVEAWFLADSQTLSVLLNEANFQFQHPETIPVPREAVQQLFLQKKGRGIGSSKPLFATKMVNHGFSITNAAAHPNCPSARYFIAKLQSLFAQ